MKLIAWGDYAEDHWRRGAAPGEPGGMVLPVDRVVLHHTVSRVTANPVTDAIQVNNYDQATFGKVSYSWLVHEPSATWLECEGLHRGAHTINNAGQSLNYTAFGIGVIGNYQNDVAGVPTIKPSSSLLQLIADGIRQYVLPNVKPQWTLLGHRDVYATACCGDLLYPHLKAIRTLIDTPHAQEDKVLHLVQGDKKPEWFVTDWITKRYVASAKEAESIIYATVANGGKIGHGPGNGPAVYPQADIDRIKAV